MSFPDLSTTGLLAACGGDTVKLFDLTTIDSGDDPCTLSYTPTVGSQVKSVKWNHTNLVVASAGDDKKISLWRKNGDSLGTLPLSSSDAGDNIDESILAINFSNKGSRYLCSGGSGCIIRIWDLQRKRCIKRLSGHSDTITGVMYNYKDEHLASISSKGDLILHNLASGARAAELKDPNGQVLRVLDYSRQSRHVLVTAGDDGSVHLWDTNGRSAKVSWLKQHSAPTTGVCFSPSSDKIIASVGLDKKLYTFDSGTKRPISCSLYEAPFSSLAYRENGYILAVGTYSGRVVFYDVRGKPQPLTVLHAYNSSEAVTSLCWQRSRPVIVNENSCTAETALLGCTGEHSVLMPDPLPSTTGLSFASTTSMSTTSRSSFTAPTSGSMSTTSHISTVEDTPQRSHSRAGGPLSKLQAPRTSYDLKDDMDVFSPLVDVQPITPSLSSWWNDTDEVKRDSQPREKKSSLFPSTTRRFPYSEGSTKPHPISDWRFHSTSSRKDYTPPSTVSQLGSTPAASSSSSTDSSLTPPEAWGGNATLVDKFSLSCHQPVSTLSHIIPAGSLLSNSIFSGLQDSSAPSSNSIGSSLTSPSLSSTNLQSKVTISQEFPSGISDSSSAFQFSSASTVLGTKSFGGRENLDFPAPASSILPLRVSTYAEKLSTLSSFSEGKNAAIGSPKLKKTGAETKEELMNILSSRQQSSAPMAKGSLPETNGEVSQSQHDLAPQSTDQQQGSSSFSLQLIQRTLEETLESVQMSIHHDVRNLHIELLRQFHMHEMFIEEKQDQLLKEVQSLRKENQQLRLLVQDLRGEFL